MTGDQEIWEKFKSGDTAATSHIYYSNVRVLYRYGKKFTPDDELVKDTIQELFFDLIRTRENLGKTDNIRFYLVKSFRRKVLLALQKKTFPIGPDKPADRFPMSITYSYEEELIDRENLSRRDELIQKALSSLSPKQREILFYRFTCDFEYDQICDIMEMQYDSARKMVYRALKSLREYLTETDFVFFYLHVRKFL
ncbi:MAG: sigma-70 family RNA polymerase sigma factor [Mangrovibacterium sp.]|nr:sigma-70 family RNA polymerase sigma factor [Mangrovibacterium sp.]